MIAPLFQPVLSLSTAQEDPVQAYQHALQLTVFLLRTCHVLLIVHDTAPDGELWRSVWLFCPS